MSAPTLTQSQICYKIKCANNVVPNPDDAHPVFDQFGNRNVTKFRPHLLCGPAESGKRFRIPLMDATQEVPPNASTATGSCDGFVDGLTFTITCTHNVVAPTAAHVHVGPPGVAGGIVFPFSSPTSPITGTWNMTIGDYGNLTIGNLYVNVHSGNCGSCPGGEIRGQWEQAP